MMSEPSGGASYLPTATAEPCACLTNDPPTSARHWSNPPQPCGSLTGCVGQGVGGGPGTRNPPRVSYQIVRQGSPWRGREGSAPFGVASLITPAPEIFLPLVG